MNETVQQMVQSLTADRDQAMTIILIERQPYAVRVEKINTPEQMQRATDEFKETLHERSS